MEDSTRHKEEETVIYEKKIEFPQFPVILKSIRVSVLSFAKKSGKISRIFLVIGFFKKFERSRRLYKILTDEMKQRSEHISALSN